MLNIKSMNNEVLGLKIARNDQLERPIFYRTGPTEKSGLPRKMDCFFFELFRLERTDSFSFRPKFPEILVEWIATLKSSLPTN